MAATQLIATGTTAATSADFDVVAGTPVTVALKGMIDDIAKIAIDLKDDAGAYNQVGVMSPGAPAVCITAPGTYRLRRPLGVTCGAFSA